MVSLKVIQISLPVVNNDKQVPIYLTNVQAGFPSPAEGYIEHQLDLNSLVIQHPSATFFVKVEGESMREANIYSGDILVVDRSLEAADGKIVVAIVNGEFTVKRLKMSRSEIVLVPENPRYPSITVGQDIDFQVWGVVTYVIHKLR